MTLRLFDCEPSFRVFPDDKTNYISKEHSKTTRAIPRLFDPLAIVGTWFQTHWIPKGIPPSDSGRLNLSAVKA